MLQPTGLAVLDALGLGQQIRSLGARIDRLTGTDARSGRKVLDVSYAPFLCRALTPFYQSDSRLMPILRDLLVAGTARIPPIQWLLAGMVSGQLLSTLSRLQLETERLREVVA